MRSGRVVIAFKTKSDKKHPYSAGGLAANAVHSVEVLREMGVRAELLPAEDFDDLVRGLEVGERPSHVVVEALWLTPQQAGHLADSFYPAQVAVRSHSKMGFLQVEPEAITNMRGVIAEALKRGNLHFSSNNEEFSTSVREAFGDCLYLPNLYDLAGAPPRRHHYCAPLKIASFGATRLLKLHPSAALSAIQIARRLGRALEFYVNTDSTPGGASVRRSMHALFSGLPDAELVEVPWQPADEFRDTISKMDLVIQLSATETFCMVAADAVASGVPVVGGPAITWLPEHCVADIDSTNSVADVAVRLLESPRLMRREREALEAQVVDARWVWDRFLSKKHR